MKSKHIFLIGIIQFIIVQCVLSPLHAQTGRLFTADVELSSSLIYGIYQDRNDIVWIATEDGLNQYDSSKFTVYKHDIDENSPLNNFVRLFMEDKNGDFYIGYFNGLQMYDYASGTFSEIPLIQENGEKFPAHICNMLQRKNGDVLVSSPNHGIFRVIEKDGEKIGIQTSDIVPSHEISCMYETINGDLWVSTENKGLFCLTSRNELKNYYHTPGVPQKSIAAICEDNQGNIYIGSMGNGLSVYNKQTDSFAYVPYNNNFHLPVKSLLWNDDEILIGTDGNGMKTYNPQAGKIGEWNFNIATFDFSKSKVHSIMKDNSGNLWLGIFQKGVMLVPSRSSRFQYIGYKSVVNNSIGSNCIMSLCMDSDGTLWVGTDSDGLYNITPGGQQKAHYAPTGRPGSVPSTIMYVFEDSNHNLWLGSYRDGLFRMNRKNGQCERVANLLDGNGYPAEHIYCIVEDKEKNIWVSTMGAGLFSININNNQVTSYNTPAGQVQNYNKEVFNHWIECLLISSDNKLYFGTYDGLGCLDLATRDFVSLMGEVQILPGWVIYAIHEDPEGKLWLATNNGLVCKNKDSNETKTYTMDDGLPSNIVCAIQGDKRGNLWITTNSGISCMNLEARTFINYYANDGLQGNEFSKNASVTDYDGNIFFGGINGITNFNPSEITGQERDLIIRITDFYIHDQSIKKGMKSGGKDIISTSVMEAREFHLSHEDNLFTFELGVMDFSNPQRIIYMYSVNGQNWITLRPGVNRIFFNNLAPGKYKFRLMAKDYNVLSEIKEVTVNISPAWYASFWAKVIYYLIGIGILVLIGMQIRHRYRIKQERLEHQYAKQVDEAKLQFFINISHEIRTPMSLILNPLRKLMATDSDSNRQNLYGIIQRNTERILNLINQLMDIRKIDKGQMLMKFSRINIAVLIKETVTLFDDLAGAKHITLTYHSDMDELNAWIDTKHFDKILINVLSNALKYTPEGGKVDVSLSTGEDKTISGPLHTYYEIKVADTGTGISEDEIERIFERFYQTRQTDNSMNQGTGIGLHLTRSIVELHHGIIRAENNSEGHGSCFIIRLPLGNEHLNSEDIDNHIAEPVTKPSAIIPSIVPTDDKEEEKTKVRSKHRILVVDDDPEIRDYICREFAGMCHVLTSENGREALELILKKAPDLVISDVMMPEMDGITLCRKIKQNVNINHVPVILLTARSKEEDNIEGLNIGADAYIVKPFSIEILKRTALSLIRNRELLKNTFTGSQQQTDKVKQVKVKSHDDKLLERIMKVINENLANPDLNVELIADRVGISRVHLYRKLKELTNQSPSDFIRNVRLQQAAQMLAAKHLNINDVATATGFTNAAHFSNAFKELYGVRPTAYMEQAKDEDK